MSIASVHPLNYVGWDKGCEAAESTAQVLDRTYFTANAGRNVYVRNLIDGELGYIGCSRGDVVLMIVRCIAPGRRSREPYAASRGRAKRFLTLPEPELIKALERPSRPTWALGPGSVYRGSVLGVRS
jgi:hypothetical protein